MKNKIKERLGEREREREKTIWGKNGETKSTKKKVRLLFVGENSLTVMEKKRVKT